MNLNFNWLNNLNPFAKTKVQEIKPKEYTIAGAPAQDFARIEMGKDDYVLDTEEIHNRTDKYAQVNFSGWVKDGSGPVYVTSIYDTKKKQFTVHREYNERSNSYGSYKSTIMTKDQYGVFENEGLLKGKYLSTGFDKPSSLDKKAKK